MFLLKKNEDGSVTLYIRGFSGCHEWEAVEKTFSGEEISSLIIELEDTLELIKKFEKYQLLSPKGVEEYSLAACPHTGNGNPVARLITLVRTLLSAFLVAILFFLSETFLYIKKNILYI